MKSIRDEDGEAWEVAALAGKRLQAAIVKLERTIEDFHWAARGAWLTAEEVRTGRMPPGDDFEESPLGRKLSSLASEVEHLQKGLKPMLTAAAFDPYA